jgi:hypothetical protein
MTDEQYQAAMRQIDDYVLTTRCRGVLRNSIYATGMDDASRASIRRKGRMWWMRQPNCGRRTVDELAELVGGWEC